MFKSVNGLCTQPHLVLFCNYLVFQLILRYFRIIANEKYISSWKSKGLSDETITPYATSDNSLTPLIDHFGTKTRLKMFKTVN